MGSEAMVLDLSKVRIKFTEVDRQGLPDWAKESAERTRAFLAQRTISMVVQSKFRDGIDGKDGKRWSKFLDHFMEEPVPLEFEVSLDDFEWLRKVVNDDDVKLFAVNAASWREAVKEWMDDMREQFKKQGTAEELKDA